MRFKNLIPLCYIYLIVFEIVYLFNKTNMFKVIVGIDKNRGIAKNGKLPWPHNKNDMQHFAHTTIGTPPEGKANAIIMGRKTWESIDSRFRPLKNRINIILSRTINIEGPNTYTYSGFDEALQFLGVSPYVNDIFVIGGQEIYEIALCDPRCKSIILTSFPDVYECDRHMPELPIWFKLTNSVVLDDITINYYDSLLDLRSSEYQYLGVLNNILETGREIKDRTGIGTIASFSAHMQFPIEVLNPDAEPTELKYRVPIMTTKTLFHRGVFEELIFFLQGRTNVKPLQDKGVHIWDGNTSREFLDLHGLKNYNDGETGPFYGFQWNYFGAEYIPETEAGNDRELCFKMDGINQLEECIRLLKTDPYSRRIVLSAWNPKALPEMCLPPCHMVYNFCVIPEPGSKHRLHCAMFQRSGDMFLGVPFNIYSTALLTIFMSRAADMLPGSISLTITNAHIYKNHVEQVRTQLQRYPYKFPILQIKKEINTLQDMRELEFTDCELTEYNKHPAIKADMAV